LITLALLCVCSPYLCLLLSYFCCLNLVVLSNHSGSRHAETKSCIKNTVWNREAVENFQESNNMVHCCSSTVELRRIFICGYKWCKVVCTSCVQWRWDWIFFPPLVMFLFFSWACLWDGAGTVGVLLIRLNHSKLVY